MSGAMSIPMRVQEVFKKLETLDWFPKLLMRLVIGYFFFETGLGKVSDLPTMTQRFIEWGIPFPAFNAALSAYTELIGGALVIVGLGTRFVSFPLFINMVVAIVTVKLKKISGLDEFVEADEPLYGLVFLWLVFSGPGMASLDAFLARMFRRAETKPVTGVSAAPAS